MPSLEQFEAALSPKAKHAMETYCIAFTDGGPSMTVRELRTMISRLYGKAVDDELEKHLADRRASVLPH